MSSATLSTAVAAHPPARPSVEPGSVGRRPRRRTTTAARPRLESSRDAKQRAAAILEVLAGGRSPTAAAEALGVSLTHYYHLEEKALLGLVAACEPQPRGRSEDPARRLAVLERECQRWQRECARQQALVRAAQRSIGLAAPAPQPAKDKGKKRRQRRPVVRALHAVARLRAEEEKAVGSASTTAATPS